MANTQPVENNMIIDNIPAQIHRDQLDAAVRALDIDPSDALEIRLTSDFIHVTAFWHDDNGRKKLDGGNAEAGWVKHTIAVPVVNKAAS